MVSSELPSDLNAPTVAIEAAGAVHHIQQFRFTVTDGVNKGLSIVTEKACIIFGTSESADLVLTDETVSRFHCELKINDDHLLLSDLDSRNGTYVNDVSIVNAYVESGHVMTIGRTRISVEELNDQVSVPVSHKQYFGKMLGTSSVMRSIFIMLERAAQTDTTVLLLGESGVGKDIAAESIHSESNRAQKDIVVVDCAALSSNLIESELFGHEKGAFTNADQTRIGAFEAAEGGTVFLDEIGELPLDLQPKLLRAIDKHEIQRVGSTKRISINTRIIAATNRDLRKEVNKGHFRLDLYYRLAVLEINIPPLRERPEDIVLLAKHFFNNTPIINDEQIKTIATEDFFKTISEHYWDGNIRELHNYIERCAVMGGNVPLSHGLSEQETQDIAIDITQPLRVIRDSWIKLIERRYVEQVLQHNNQNVTAAAKQAGIDRTSFYRLLKRCDLK